MFKASLNAYRAGSERAATSGGNELGRREVMRLIVVLTMVWHKEQTVLQVGYRALMRWRSNRRPRLESGVGLGRQASLGARSMASQGSGGGTALGFHDLPP